MGGQLAERRERRERWCWGGRGPGYEPTNKVDSTQRIGDLTIRIWDFPSTLIQSSTGKSYIYIYYIYIRLMGWFQFNLFWAKCWKCPAGFPKKLWEEWMLTTKNMGSTLHKDWLGTTNRHSDTNRYTEKRRWFSGLHKNNVHIPRYSMYGTIIYLHLPQTWPTCS